MCPGAASTYMLVDENHRSINDAGFATIGPGAPNFRMIDWPATYHNMAAGFAFADGHSEIRKWVWPETDLELGKTNLSRVAFAARTSFGCRNEPLHLINK